MDISDEKYRLFVEVDGVEGEVTSEGYENHIKAYGYTHSGSNFVPMGQNGQHTCQAAAKLEVITLYKPVDLSTPAFFTKMTTGDSLKKVELKVLVAMGDGLAHVGGVELTGVSVSRQEVSMDRYDGWQEEVDFSYKAVRHTYMQQDEEGKVKGNLEGTWDTQKLKKL